MSRERPVKRGMNMAGGMGMGWKSLKYSSEQAPKPKITKTMLLRILRYFIPYWRHLIVVITAITATALLGLIPPLLTQRIIDVALPGKNLYLLGMLTLASLGATVAIGLIGVGQNYLNTWISSHITFNMRNQMYKHLEYMSLSFFSNVKTGEIITRMTSDIGGVQDVFRNTVVNTISNVFILVSTAAVLLSMNWKLAIAGILVVPLFAFPTRKVGKVRWKIASETQGKLGELNQIIQETLSISGSTLLKIFTREKDELEGFKKINTEVTKLQIKESNAGRWFIMTITIFATIGPLLIYFWGGYLFIKEEISVGAIIAFVALLGRLYGPVVQLSSIHIDITRSLALFERIFEYLDKKPDIEDAPTAKPLGTVEGRVVFRNVGFSYNEKQAALENISFTSEPGKMIALVGPSGAGKTTVTNLIPRLYDVCSGSITIDGKDIRQVTLESLRANIGIVMQDSYLFNGTIKENLLYAKKNAADKELEAACRDAYIHDFIMSLPEGYDTVVGNRGIKLSGGEKQRISIARIILKNPGIMILDEATSALDSVSESYIQQAIKPLLKGRTSFVIAHRLSTVMMADRILVLDKGRIVETGRHEELLEKNGLYKVLYDTQFAEQKDTEA